MIASLHSSPKTSIILIYPSPPRPAPYQPRPQGAFPPHLKAREKRPLDEVGSLLACDSKRTQKRAERTEHPVFISKSAFDGQLMHWIKYMKSAV